MGYSRPQKNTRFACPPSVVFFVDVNSTSLYARAKNLVQGIAEGATSSKRNVSRPSGRVNAEREYNILDGVAAAEDRRVQSTIATMMVAASTLTTLLPRRGHGIASRSQRASPSLASELTTLLLRQWHGIASRSRTASPPWRLRRFPSLPRNRLIRLGRWDGRGLLAHDAAASSVARNCPAFLGGFAVIAPPELTIATEKSIDSTR